MAQLHFYGTSVDTFNVLQAVTRTRFFQLTPCNNYSTPKANSYKEVTCALVEALSINRCLYVTGAFSTTPLQFRQVIGGSANGTFIIDDDCTQMLGEPYGGPAFQIMVPPFNRQEAGILGLSPGYVHRHRQFWRENDKRPFPPPDDLKKAYDTCVRHVKEVVTRRKVGDHHVWIGEEAYELLHSSKALILIGGNWLSAHKQIVRSNLPLRTMHVNLSRRRNK